MSIVPPSGRRVSALVIAKAPAAGRTKTRLSPPLSTSEAAQLGCAMLLDTVDTCRAEVPETGVLFEHPQEAAELAELVGADTWRVLQTGKGLTGALVSGTVEGLRRSDAVALLASDIPGVPPGALTGAFDALAAGAHVALGPGYDGGFWLVALAAPHAALFKDIPWSTSRTLASTIERCEQAGLAVSLTEPWRDVDTTEDLAALVPLLDELPGRRTAMLVAQLASAGILRGPGAEQLCRSQPEEVHLP